MLPKLHECCPTRLPSRAFRDVMRIRNVLASFSEFDPGALTLTPQEFEDYKSKYLDLAQRGEGSGGDGADAQPSPLTAIDFELELIRQDEINVAYILALLIALAMETRAKGAQSRAQKCSAVVFSIYSPRKHSCGTSALPLAGLSTSAYRRLASMRTTHRIRSVLVRRTRQDYADLCARKDLDQAGVPADQCDGFR